MTEETEAQIRQLICERSFWGHAWEGPYTIHSPQTPTKDLIYVCSYCGAKAKNRFLEWFLKLFRRD